MNKADAKKLKRRVPSVCWRCGKMSEFACDYPNCNRGICYAMGDKSGKCGAHKAGHEVCAEHENQSLRFD